VEPKKPCEEHPKQGSSGRAEGKKTPELGYKRSVSELVRAAHSQRIKNLVRPSNTEIAWAFQHTGRAPRSSYRKTLRQRAWVVPLTCFAELEKASRRPRQAQHVGKLCE